MTDSAVQVDTARPLPMRAVTITDDFWAPRRELVRTRTLPQQEKQLREGGQFEALRLQWQLGDANEPHIFWESDVAKWIEAASYSLAKHPDLKLDAAVDEAIGLLGGAQQLDGYLNVYFTVVKPGERFTDLRDAHEMYCAGHLIEAGVAHYDATGKRSLLEIVQRYADLIEREIAPGGAIEGGYDGHQEIELALIKLANATGEDRYRSLALRMLNSRGTKPFYFELEHEHRGTPGYFGQLFPQRQEEAERFRQYNQSHEPVRQQSDAVGHSVRAMYMYSAMADLAASLKDEGLRAATERLWNSTTQRKMYLTGGIGSDPSIEGFGPDFDLSLDHAYAETCAAIGLVFWAQRMALLTGDGKYVDVLERALYNGVLSGASAEGTHYFYGNPLQSDGTAVRQEWFGVACCPPNFARLVESLEYYAYAEAHRVAIVNLAISGSARFEWDDITVTLQVDSDGPWSGHSRIAVQLDTPAEFEIRVRVPGWAPGHRLTVNGIELTEQVENGFLHLARQWSDGDIIELDIEVPTERVWARVDVRDTVDRVAIRRGPFIYCFEGIDHDVSVDRLILPRDARLTPEWDPERDLMTVHAVGLQEEDDADELYLSAAPSVRPAHLTAVPYYSWANRGKSTMEVWIRDTDAH